MNEHRMSVTGFVKQIFAAACVWAVGAVSAIAATINVPGDQPTIQAAVNAAQVGDTIVVAAGPYTEQVLVDKTLIIQGAKAGISAGAAPGARGVAETIINGGFLIQAPSHGTVIDGFTIQNGYAYGGHMNGVGVGRDLGGAVTDVKIQNNIIKDVGGSQSQGIEIVAGCNNLLIKNNEIANNWRGVYLNPASGVTIEGNAIHANNGVGVGIGSSGQSNITVTGNKIYDHTVEGWGMDTLGTGAVASNNNFYNNAVSVANYAPGAALDASQNYWGSESGAGTTVSGAITTLPYYKDALHTILYAPVKNVTRSTYYATIQAAITAATSGDTILLDAITYVEDVQISKSLTLTGAAETIISGNVTLDAGDITVTAVTLAANKQWIVTTSGSIQDAISAAANNEKIEVRSGTYAGNVDATAKTVKLAAGASPGKVTVDGNLVLNSGDLLEFELNGTDPGSISGYDQWVVNGDVTLSDATLAVSLGFVPAVGTAFTIIDNDGSDAVSGTFAGLAEGATNDVHGIYFSISYAGGTGNDVVLTVLSPSTVYVDDNYTAEACDGLIWGYDAFATIQDGIDAVATGGTVSVAVGTYINNITLSVTKSLNIIGDGAATTIVDGNDAGSVFEVDGDIDVSIAGLTIQNGSATTGGGIYVHSGAHYDSSLALYDCVLTNNVATTGNGGALANAALYEAVVLDGCTFIGNTATNGQGGAVSIIDGELAMVNCTVSGNTAKNGGGLAFNFGTGIDLDHITVTLNTATGSSASKGGGLYPNGASGTVANSLVCGNTDQFSGTTLDGITTDNVNGALPGGSNNLRDQDAKLGALADNGGPTPTHKLLPGSPALNTAAGTVAYDQRGVPRAQGNAPDIGAYELVYLAFVDDNYTSASCGGHVWGQDAFATVQAAINAVSVGGTVNVAAGTYTENLSISKKITLIGSGNDTIVAGGVSPAITLTAGGVGPADRLRITDLRLTGASDGIRIDSTISYITLDTITVNCNYGFEIHNSANITDLKVTNCLFSDCSVGIRKAISGRIDGLLVENSSFEDGASGINVAQDKIDAATAFNNVRISGCTFQDISSKGIYVEALNNALFENNVFSSCGTTGGGAAGIDINLKYGAYQNIQILNSGFMNCGTGDAVNGAGITVKARDDGNYASPPATLTGVTLTGLTVSGCPDGIRFGEPGKSNAGPTNVTVQYCNLANNLINGIRNESLTRTDAENNWFGDVTGPVNPANPGATGSAVVGNVDFSPWLGDGTDGSGVIGFQPNPAPIYYTPTSLVFTQQPGGADLGDPLSQQPIVEVKGEDGTVAIQYQGPVTVSIGVNPDGGVLAGHLTVNAENGVASFSDLQVDVGGGIGFQLLASVAAVPPLTVLSGTFNIVNPLPAIASLNPYWARAEGPGFELTVTGTDFVPTSVVYWNDEARTTRYVSGNQLTADIPAGDIASDGTAKVKVVTATSGGGTTAELTFRIENAAPSMVYVDDSYGNSPNDTLVDWPYSGAPGAGTHIIGYDAFATVQSGVTAVIAGGTVNVAAGTYVANGLIGKAVTLLGPNAGSNPNTGARVLPEAVLTGTTPSGLSDFLEINAQNVVINGFTFDNLRIDNYNNTTGINPKLIGGVTVRDNIFVNVIGTVIYLRDGRDSFEYSVGVTIINNKILPLTSAGGNDFEAGSGMIIMGAEASTISGNVIVSASYNGIQLACCKDMSISGNTATGAAQPALQIATWNAGTITVSGNTFSTLSTAKAAVRLYGFTNNYFPQFAFTGNTIKDSKYDIQIGHEDAGKTYNDIRDADYSFSGNTFSNIGTYRLVVYLPTAASAAENTEMDTLFAQAYVVGSTAKAITSADPFTYIAIPNPVWVDDNYIAEACGGHIWGYDAFTTIQSGVNAVVTAGTVHVAAGTYEESVAVNKSADLRGPNFGTSPNNSVRVAEAIVVPTTTNNTESVFTVTASNVSIDGFMIDGDNPSLPESGVGIGGIYGASIDAAQGIYANSNGLTEVTLKNNIVQNFSYAGILLQQVNNYFATSTGATFSYNNTVSGNRVANIMSIGILLNSSFYAAVMDNVISNAVTGLYFNSMRTENKGVAATRVVSGNSIQARRMSMRFNLCSATPYTVSNNSLTAFPDSTQAKWYGIVLATVSGAQNFMSQLNPPKVVEPEFFSFAGNTINGSGTDASTVGHGYWLFYVDNFRDDLGVDHFTTITGGTVSNVDVGVFLSNVDSVWGKAACGSHANFSGIAISVKTGGKGIYLKDDPSWTVGNPSPLIAKRDVILSIGSGVSLTGGSQGVVIEQPYASVQGSVNDLAFVGQTGDYIQLVTNSYNVDATASTFEGLTGALATSALNFAIENKITHKVDNVALGFVRVATGAVYVPVTSGTIDNAIMAATTGDVIYVEDGVPLVLTVEITKSITFSGNFAITSANIPSDATATTVLTSFMSRRGSSTVTANVSGMNDAQIAAVNANLAGFASITGNPVTIIRGGTTVGYAPTIQAGVNFAVAGDIVSAAAGSYTELVTVNKALTLVNQPARSATLTAPGSANNAALIRIQANDVVLLRLA